MAEVETQRNDWQDAYDEGYDDGYDDGQRDSGESAEVSYSEGYTEGFEEGVKSVEYVKRIGEALNDIEDLYVRQEALTSFKRVFPTLYWTTDERGRIVVDE